MMTRTVISKSTEKKKFLTPTGFRMGRKEQVVYRTRLSNGKLSSVTKHEIIFDKH